MCRPTKSSRRSKGRSTASSGSTTTGSRGRARKRLIESPPPSSIEPMSVVLDRVPGQASAIAFLLGAAERPHHAYVFAGPEGSGKSLGARAFAAALLCHDGGCDECRDCRLALGDRHPNEFLIEPE